MFRLGKMDQSGFEPEVSCTEGALSRLKEEGRAVGRILPSCACHARVWTQDADLLRHTLSRLDHWPKLQYSNKLNIIILYKITPADKLSTLRCDVYAAILGRCLQAFKTGRCTMGMKRGRALGGLSRRLCS